MLEKREAGSPGSGSEALTSSCKLKFIWLEVESVGSRCSSKVRRTKPCRDALEHFIVVQE
jgi:hypothetical protein